MKRLNSVNHELLKSVISDLSHHTLLTSKVQLYDIVQKHKKVSGYSWTSESSENYKQINYTPICNWLESNGFIKLLQTVEDCPKYHIYITPKCRPITTGIILPNKYDSIKFQ